MGDRDSPSNSSLLSGTQDARRVASAARVVRAAPPPEQWTLVRELNMEKRDPCEIWRSGVNHQLFKMKQQLSSCGSEIERLERDIELDRQVMASSRHTSGSSSHLHSPCSTCMPSSQ